MIRREAGAAAGVGPAPVGMVLGAVGSLQFGAALAVELFDELGPLGAVALRLGIAAVVLVAIWRPRTRDASRADLRLAVLFGLVLGSMNALIYLAMDRIPLGIAVTLEFAGPLGVAVAGSRRGRDAGWALLAAGGVALLSGGIGRLDPLGMAFALLAGACWAAYILLGARVGAAFPGGRGLALAMVAGALLVMPAGILAAGGALLRPELLGLGAAVALLSSVVPYSLELEALRRMPARLFGVLMSLEPAVAALAGFAVLGQALSTAEVCAVGMVVAASAGAALGSGAAPPAV